LADDFITLIKTLLEPIIFGTIVVEIARMGIGNGIATIAIAK
jgi:Na+/H+-dicarboxylate symporter